MSLLALLASAGGGTVDPPNGLVNLYPSATPQAVPTPIAHWDFREAAAPYYTTTATGGDLPLELGATSTAPMPVASTPIGRALLMDGTQWLRVPDTDVGRLNLGGAGAVTVAAWVLTFTDGQTVMAGIWGETFTPPTRQYALFRDLPAYGGDDMTCFHVSKDGGPTPGYPYSTDYSAEPDVSVVGRWELHVGTYDGAQAVSYMNGLAHQHTSHSTRSGDGKRNPYTFPLGLNGAAEDFTVGALPDGTSNLRGYIADVRVWDQALTPGQVLTLAAEHTPAKVSTVPTPVVTFRERRGAVGLPPSATQTMTGMDVGAAGAGRLVVAVIYGRAEWTAPRTLQSATISGVAATVVGSGGRGFAYAVVPTGATADVTATWNGPVIDYQVSTFTVAGSKTTHSTQAEAVSKKAVIINAPDKAAVLAVAFPTGTPHTWGPLSTKLFDDYDPQGAIRSSASVTAGIGLPALIHFTNGVGTAPHSLHAIAFDPA